MTNEQNPIPLDDEKVKGSPLEKTKGKRIWELDALKAFAFFFMVLDHAMFDLAFVFRPMWSHADRNHFLIKLCNTAIDYRFSSTVDVLRLVMCAGIFMFVSGACCVFSRNNLYRGLRLTVIAIALSIITYVLSIMLDIDMHIKYGILAMLSASMILGHFLVRLDWKTLIIIALYALFLGHAFSQISTRDTLFLPFLNFYSPYYVSADHYPIFPNIAYFILGIAFAKVFYKDKRSLLPINPKIISVPAELISKHLIVLYFAHQVVVFVLLYLLGVVFL